MPIVFRPAAERGRLVDPGLSGTAAFSHGSAFDRDWLGFHALRVLNRVELAPGARLPAARRANMELLTLVLSGTYRATSAAGDSGPVVTGGAYRLGAGAGVDLVEENPDPAVASRLVQLWVAPTHSNARPAHAVAHVDGPGPIAGPASAPLPWSAAASVRREGIAPGAMRALPTTSTSACWIEVLDGELALGGRILRRGDGVGIAGEPALALVSCFGADVLVVDLPA